MCCQISHRPHEIRCFFNSSTLSLQTSRKVNTRIKKKRKMFKVFCRVSISPLLRKPKDPPQGSKPLLLPLSNRRRQRHRGRLPHHCRWRPAQHPRAQVPRPYLPFPAGKWPRRAHVMREAHGPLLQPGASRLRLFYLLLLRLRLRFVVVPVMTPDPL